MESKNVLETIIDFIKSVVKYIDGKKTYTVALMVMAVLVLYHYGVLDESARDWFLTFLVPGGIIALKSALKKIEKPAEK